MGSFYRSQHELVMVFRKGKSHRNNVQLGKYGRYRTNVCQYPGIYSLSKQCEEGNLLALHSTVQPVAMVRTLKGNCRNCQQRNADRTAHIAPAGERSPVPSRSGNLQVRGEIQEYGGLNLVSY